MECEATFNIESLIMRFHDLSMSNDPMLAAQGRLGKAIAEPFKTWLENERGRSSPVEVMMAVQAICCTMLGSTFMTVFPSTVRDSLQDVVVEKCQRDVKEALESVMKWAAAQKAKESTLVN